VTATFALSTTQAGLLGSAGLVMSAVGGTMAGALADAAGRVWVLIRLEHRHRFARALPRDPVERTRDTHSCRSGCDVRRGGEPGGNCGNKVRNSD
jgi:hypothetical protein